MYPANAERKARRREEWEALINESVPTKTAKLLFGLGFGCAGLYCIVIRRVPLVLAFARQGMRRALPGTDTITEWATIVVAVVVGNLPGLWTPIVLGSMVALLGIGAGLVWVFTLLRGTRKYRRVIFGPNDRAAYGAPTAAESVITRHTNKPSPSATLPRLA